jgi:predicted enzyme related to lactoylglutathione lyase
MGRRERYEPGTFCWVDLATTDPAGAKDFYGALFGWKAEHRSAGETGAYTMLSLDGDEVCGLYELDAGRCEQAGTSFRAGIPKQQATSTLSTWCSRMPASATGTSCR